MAHGKAGMDLFGFKKERVWFYLTDHEEVSVRTFVARMRAREVQLSILGLFRRKGVVLWLSDEGKLKAKSSTNTPLSDETIATMKEHRELIVSALKAEEVQGETWDHSALKADVHALYQQVDGNYTAGIAKQECIELVEVLDAFLAELDEVGWLGLPDAVARYATRRPVMETLIRRINAERCMAMEGADLTKAVRETFKDSIKRRTGINVSALD